MEDETGEYKVGECAVESQRWHVEGRTDRSGEMVEKTALLAGLTWERREAASTN